LASYTLAFALQLREKHGKNSVRVVSMQFLSNYYYRCRNMFNNLKDKVKVCPKTCHEVIERE
jgi:hypothetical protein